MARISERTWIFVSHSSEDLEAVRQVRNYLEAKDASPLLFHLLSLKHEEEFWPIIERKILERDFFLLCDSEGATRSEWVQRERAAVERAAAQKPKRRWNIRVDGPDLDLASLDAFISSTRVFPSFTHRDRDQVWPYLAALQSRGFEVFNELEELKPATDFASEIMKAMADAAARGFILFFITSNSLKSRWVEQEIDYAIKHRARLVPVLIDRSVNTAAVPPTLQAYRIFDATISPHSAPDELASLLHRASF